jgi:hypothetical protein
MYWYELTVSWTEAYIRTVVYCNNNLVTLTRDNCILMVEVKNHQKNILFSKMLY